MAEHKHYATDEPAPPTLRTRLDRLEEKARELETAIERIGNVAEQACREIGLDVRDTYA